MKKKYRFKKGDKVMCINSSFGDVYKKGDIYEVRKHAINSDTLYTTFDNRGSITNGWYATNFIPAYQLILNFGE